MRLTIGCVLAVLSATLVPIAAFGSGYDDARTADVRACQAIDPHSYQSGLWLNPDGYRSFYVRSQCFQAAAVRFRDETLCRQVRQRRALFSSSWGYSSSRCRQLVAEGRAADRTALEQERRLYAEGGMKIRDFRVERNGNGRDFDIIPAFSGHYAHGYHLTFEIVAGPAQRPVLVHSDGYFVDTASTLRIFVRQEEIRQRLPSFATGRPYLVRATLVLSVGSGGSSAYWSDRFIEQILPIAKRSNSIDREVTF